MVLRRVQYAISIHALHEESDFFRAAPQAADRFQSTLSMRRATHQLPLRLRPWRISIHALHEESDRDHRHVVQAGRISIHALHEESDPQSMAGRLHGRMISIHALHEESDLSTFVYRPPFLTFQSTLSMRRATCRRQGPGRAYHDFNPRSP